MSSFVMRRALGALLPAALLLALALAGAPPAPESAAAPLAVHLLGRSAGLEREIRGGDFFRWAERRHAAQVAIGPRADGRTLILVDLLPLEPATRGLLTGLPATANGQGIAFAGARYGPQDALAVRLPAAPRPTWVVAGARPEAVASLLDEILFRLAGRGRRGAAPPVDYLVRETPWLARSGRWLATAGASGRWEIDRAADHDELAARDREVAGLVRLPGKRMTLLAPKALAGRPEIAALAAALDRAVAEMAPRIGPAPGAPLTIELAPDYTAEARSSGRIGAAVPGARTDLVLVYAPEDLFADRCALAAALLARAGVAAPPALRRGAALWAAGGGWYGRPYRDWLPLLAAARALPSAAELLADPEPEDGSEPLWTPAAAAVVERLPGTTAAEKLAQVPAPAAVSAALAAVLAAAARHPASVPAPAPRPTLPFLKGVSLAMLNSLEGGYHAPGLGERLDRLRRLGADAVSLMPFAFQAARDEPRLAFLNRRPEGESDIGLIHAARLAQGRGMRVMWKPHLWVAGDGWPGEVQMRSAAAWAAWWGSYRRYVLHHAFLARWAGADLFAVGCELSRTVPHAAEWRELIAAVRVLFPGAVTYASNWGSDLDAVTFWDRLDYVGVDAYDPLAPTLAATPATLARGAAALADRLAAVSRRAGRPVLLTEVGFAARRGAWVAPHEEGGDYSEDDQAASYEALFAALDRRPWLGGAFVWKVFSGDERWGARPDFRFLDRKAEKVIAKYYQR